MRAITLTFVTIATPQPPDDEMMNGFSDVNREWSTKETDAGEFRTGPRRIERTPGGSLLIRPCSNAMEALFNGFAGPISLGRLACERDRPLTIALGHLSRTLG
jgi:hypothetical protein